MTYNSVNEFSSQQRGYLLVSVVALIGVPPFMGFYLKWVLFDSVLRTRRGSPVAFVFLLAGVVNMW